MLVKKFATFKSKNGNLLLNSSVGVFQVVINSALTFLSVPIFINKLGTSDYGTFTIITVAADLNLLANFGLTMSLSKFISEQGRGKESDQDIITTIYIYTIIIVPIITILIFSKKIILLDLMSLDKIQFENSYILYICALISSYLLILGQIFRAVLESINLSYKNSYLQLIYSIIYWILLLVLVNVSENLNYLGIALLVSAAVWLILQYKQVKKNWGVLRYNIPKDVFFSTAKKQIKYGFNLYCVNLIGMLYEPLSKILTAKLFGMTEVAYLEIGYKIRNIFTSIFSKVLSPLFPIIASNREKSTMQTINLLEKHIMFCSIMLLGFLSILLPFGIRLWLGFENINDILSICFPIVAGYLLFSVPVVPSYYYFISKNKTIYTLYMQLSAVIVNIAIILLFRKYSSNHVIVIGNFTGIMFSFFVSKYLRKELKKSITNIEHIILGILVFLPMIAMKSFEIEYNLETITASILWISITSVVLIVRYGIIQSCKTLVYSLTN